MAVQLRKGGRRRAPYASDYENMESLFTNGKKKFVKYEEGAAMYSMGIHAFTELAKEAKAIYRIRRIVLVNTEIIDEYIENFRDI